MSKALTVFWKQYLKLHYVLKQLSARWLQCKVYEKKNHACAWKCGQGLIETTDCTLTRKNAFCYPVVSFPQDFEVCRALLASFSVHNFIHHCWKYANENKDCAFLKYLYLDEISQHYWVQK